jgi:hypothetical protein
MEIQSMRGCKLRRDSYRESVNNVSKALLNHIVTQSLELEPSPYDFCSAPSWAWPEGKETRDEAEGRHDEISDLISQNLKENLRFGLTLFKLLL